MKPIRNILILLILLSPTLALAGAGKAIFVIGKVEVKNTDGEVRVLKRGGEILSGDVILTSKRGQAQLKMDDGTLLAVRPSSEFTISEYRYEKDVANDKSIYKLVKGGFRSITGKMGKAKKSSYAVKTVVGTIGIRGTDFSARLCDSNCGESDNGLYVGVMEGGVTLSNDSGDLDVSPGDFGYMSDSGVEPVYLDSMPGNLLFAKSSDNTANTKIASTASSETNPVENTTDIPTDVKEELVVAQAPVNQNINLPENLSRVSSNDSIDEPVAVVDPIDDPVIDPVDEPVVDPIVPEVLALPSTGIFRFTTTVDNASITDTVNIVTANTIDTSLSDLTLNFANSTVDLVYAVNGVETTATPATTDWMAVNEDVITYDQYGNFSGNLIEIGTAELGTASGSLIDTTPDTIDSPSSVDTTFTISNGEGSISGTVSFINPVEN